MLRRFGGCASRCLLSFAPRDHHLRPLHAVLRGASNSSRRGPSSSSQSSPSQSPAPGDEALSAERAERHSTEVYADLVKSLLLAGQVRDASDVLEQMPRQGFRPTTGLCNIVMAAWVSEGGQVGQKQALKVWQLMRTEGVRRGERSAALALLASTMQNDEQSTAEVLRTVQQGEDPLDPVQVGKFFAEHAKENTLARTESLKLFAAKKAIDQPSREVLLQIVTESINIYNKNVQMHQQQQQQQKSYGSESGHLPEEQSLDPLFREQLNLETRAATDAVLKYRSVMQNVINLGHGANTGPAQDILLLWYEPLVREISEEHRRIGAKDAGRDRSVYGPKLLCVDAERLAVITIHEALGLLLASPQGVKFTSLAVAIGSAVQAEWYFSKTRQEGSQLVSYLRSNGELLTVNTVNKVAKWQSDEGSWGSKLQAKIGGVLVELLLKSARIPPNLTYQDLVKRKKNMEKGITNDMTPQEDWPLAFKHGYRFVGKKKFGTINCLPEVLETIEAGHSLRETINARYLPMLVPPRPWSAPYTGGYLAYRNWVMRTKGSDMQRQALIDAQLSPVYKALDILGSTPWRINKFVFKIVEEAWEAGGGILELPSKKDLVIPQPPSDFTDDPKARKRFQAFQRRVIQQQRDLHGLRCALKYQLAVASEFKDRVFYFPHNLDFRGRSYPIPPHLNQMGSDLCRGLLTFAEAKPLGRSGLRWLKIHLANLYGNDKITHDERISFIDAHLDDIRLSSEDPLGKGSWWKDADNPWQALAVCRALTEALASPNPEEYMCNVPVHQDGSCNGLQHYAALGGDILGAEQVNLLPRPSPQDVYGGVAKLVAKRVAEDASNGNRLGELLNGKIDRKIVKQTVMTSVYGVTFVGARKQIYNAMRSKFQLSEDDVFSASSYITRHTFEALQQMFIAAREIMAWLGECARRIAKTGKPVTWVTPLGLPVVQPYRRAGRSAVVTLVQTVILEDQNDKLPVNVARQKSAFAPNFVHSLDSTHMMLTAKAVNELGLTFASVHDSFWTHAGDVDVMNKILRESFVTLHSEPLLEQLAAYFKRTYPEVDFPKLPQRGQLDLKEVLRSPYFFH